MNVSIQTSRDHIYSPVGFMGWDLPIEEAHIFLKDLECSYSPCHYNYKSEDGAYYRKDSNAVEGSVNAIMLDFDDGLTLSEAKVMFSSYECVIATTKSHQKDKNGIVCDRFRVIIPATTPINLDKKQYSELMGYIMEIYPQADKACKNISRFYFSNPNAEIFMSDGTESFDWESVYEKARKLKAIERQRYEIATPKRNVAYTFDGEKVDYLRSILGTEKLLDVVKFHEKFSSGGRNNYLYSVAMYLKESGLSDSEIVGAVYWINAQGDGINEDEICKTIFRSMRVEC